MANKIRRVDYFYCSVQDNPGEAYKILSQLAEIGVNLLAFTAVPTGLLHTQFTLFPEDSSKLQSEAQKASLKLEGPNPAILIQGDDQLGALTEVHEKLYRSNINITASTGVTDGKGSFGYVIYIRPEQFESAAQTLGI